jgi:DNA mismatch repair ATPase MutS
MGVMAPTFLIYDANGGPALMSLIGHLLMYLGRDALNQSGFEEASHLSEIFERNNGKVVELLKQTRDPVLWQIGDTLDRANDPKREDSFALARRRLGRARFVQQSIFLPGYLKMTRATRGLTPFLEAIIEYLDALSELELIAGIANYQLKNPGFQMLEVKPRATGAMRIAEAHNPQFLIRQNQMGIPSRPNQFQFSPEHRVELVTGANAMGKSSGMRTENIVNLATLVGLPVPAKGDLSPMVMIAGNKVADTLGKSLMMAQCERVAQMLTAAQDLASKGIRVMLKFDEPFDGTSPEERRALVAAIIIFIGGQPNMYASIATHERSLIDLVSGMEAANRLRVPIGDTSPAALMGQYSEALRGVRNVHYANYEKVEGGATTRNALIIAAKMGMPEAVIAIARDILDSSGVVSE